MFPHPLFQTCAICLVLWLLAFYTGPGRADIINPPASTGPSSELHIGRLVHRHGNHSTWGPGRPWWRIDWPEAEQHFIAGLNRYTVIDVAGDSAHLTLFDDSIFDYPWF